jgi:hypothetical protein
MLELTKHDDAYHDVHADVSALMLSVPVSYPEDCEVTITKRLHQQLSRQILQLMR